MAAAPDILFLNTTLPNAALCTGLAVALLLALAKRVARAANLFLSLALAVAVLKVSGLTPLLLPALGPLLYLYVRQLSHPAGKFHRNDLAHFCPLLVAFWIPAWLALISAVAYLYLSYRLIQGFYRKLQLVLMDRPRFAFRRLDKALFMLGAFCLSAPFTNLSYWGVAAVLIGLAVEAVIKQDGAPAMSIPATDRYDAKEKARRLKEAVVANRLYEDAELTLASLAGKLKIHPHDLSRIINTGLEKNFADFINEFRVREVARKMLDPACDQFTLTGIAYGSGFNSERTFHRVFKEITGKTPLGYKNSLKKGLPIDKLAPRAQFQPLILRKGSPPVWASVKIKRNFMWKNYLKTAWRNIIRDKGYSALNILGLATGMAVTLLIGLWIYYQYSYDRSLTGYGQAYQVKSNYNANADINTQPSTPTKLADVLRAEFPEIEYVSETDWFGSHGLKAGDKKLYSSGGQVQKDFLKIFQFPLLRGNAGTVLADPYSIVLTASTAKSLFGEEDPVGKIVRFDNTNDLKVTGILRDLSPNSNFGFHYLVPFSYYEQTTPWVKKMRYMSFGSGNAFMQFVKLRPGVSYAQLAPKIKDIEKRDNDPNAKTTEVILQPLKDWKLYTDFKNGKEAGGFVDYVRLFGITGLLILAIACINFVNLTTARSEKRAREVGIRKAIGSGRRSLVIQFLAESFLMVFFAFLVAVLLAMLALPAFNALTGSNVTIPFSNGWFWLLMAGSTGITALAAGGRPAFYLSSFQPVKVLKGRLNAGRAATLPRKILVVVQFSCSVALIISTMVIYQQIQHAKDRPTGYDLDRVMVTGASDDIVRHFEALKNEMVNTGVATSVTLSSTSATGINLHDDISSWPGQKAGERAALGTVWVNRDYFKTLGMKLAQGRDFNGISDKATVILNQAAVKRLGLKDPLNQTIKYDTTRTIVGVVKDALMQSPYSPADPTMFLYDYDPSPQSVVLYRLSPKIATQDAIAKLGPVFNKYNPVYPFDYQFEDASYAAKFNAEVLVARLAGIFAGLAIFISCLGLFGLAAYMAEQRNKEISIRKVVGASILQVWQLLTKDFIILVLISCLIACPAAFYFLNDWLQNYDYRITLRPWAFIAATAAAIVITVATISFHAIKAAVTNPVKSLRSE